MSFQIIFDLNAANGEKLFISFLYNTFTIFISLNILYKADKWIVNLDNWQAARQSGSHINQDVKKTDDR